MQKIAVVILNYHVSDLVLECIKSVRQSSYKDLYIIVVDNSPDDGLEDKLNTDIIYLASQNNGYSGGNNLGIKEALRRGADLVFILNPDTTIDKKCIEYLVDGLKLYRAGIVCPKIYFEDGKTIWYAGKDFDSLNVIGRHRGVDEKDLGQFDEDRSTEATGASLLVKKEVFDSIGMFDERYFLYLEDSDFSLRARKGGFKVMYIAKAVVFHKNAQSTGLGSPKQDYYISRNRMLYASKFLSFRTRFALFREALRNLGNPMRRLALWDFITGNLGKGSL